MGDAFDVLGIVAALAFLGLADLKQKFPRLGEFQYLVVMVDVFIFRIASYSASPTNRPARKLSITAAMP